MSNVSVLPVVGHRRSLKGYRLTIRYVGPVEGKPGEWLGVEWDDPHRGKHDGSFQNHRYFNCDSKSSTAASFLKTHQQWDPVYSFTEGLADKYAAEYTSQVIRISGKEVKEVGFEEFGQRQAELRGITTIVLNDMKIKHNVGDETENQMIRLKCSHITDLDIGCNLFESLNEIFDLISQFPSLQSLSLDGNRFVAHRRDINLSPLEKVKHLSLSRTHLSPSTCSGIIRELFPKLQTINLERNEWAELQSVPLPKPLHSVSLSENSLTRLADIHLFNHESLRNLELKNNQITEVGSVASNKVERLDLGFNSISDMTFFDSLASNFPSLKHLRVSGNPVYTSLKKLDGQPFTSDEAFMLTLARVPQLETLNFSTILPKERLEADIFYMKQITDELRAASPDTRSLVLNLHARWNELCREYGEPEISSKNELADQYPIHTLGAHLVSITFHFLNKRLLPNAITISWTQDLPKSCSIYTLLGLLGKRLQIMPLDLELIWETGERDPVHSGIAREAPEWWDSDDDEVDGEDSQSKNQFDADKWVAREVELQAGTQPLGTYIDGRDAIVRIQLKRNSRVC